MLLRSLCVLLALTTFAEAKYVLMTSVAPGEEERIERAFRRAARLRSGETLEVRHRATQWELQQSFQDPTVEAVFWFSHGLSAPRGGESLIRPKLLDHRGDDVAAAFALAPARLRFLAVVGCNSEEILEYHGVDTSLRGRSYVARARRANALSEVSRAWRSFRRNEPTRLPEERPELSQGTLRVTRVVSSAADPKLQRALRVVVGGYTRGMLPPSGGTVFIEVPTGVALDVRIESGESLADLSVLGEMGQITVTSDEISGEWRQFSDALGNPLGVNLRVFRHM